MSEGDGEERPTAPGPASPEPGQKVLGFTRGGTLSTAEERRIAALRSDAEQRRAEQDQEIRLSREAGARRQVFDLGSPQQHPVAVLQIDINGQKEFAQCDIVTLGANDLALVVPCPGCLFRGLPMDQSQIHIRQSHRKWTIDPKFLGQVWIDPETGASYTLAGKVGGEETYRCDRGCGYAFVIDDRTDTGFPGVSRMVRVRA